jgi:surface protein
MSPRGFRRLCAVGAALFSALFVVVFGGVVPAHAAPANQMQLEFATSGMYENISVTLGGELNNVVINWGDLDSDPGTTDVIQNVTNQGPGSGDVTLTQTVDFGGTYVVSITATKLERFGKCLGGSDTTLTKVLSWGDFGMTSLRCGFDHRSELRQVPATLPATVTDLSNAFSYANAFNQDISGWNTSNVTNMSKMFESAVSFNQSLANWNISNVTNMTDIFKKVVSYSMSNENYSSTLVGWVAQTVQPNLNLGPVTMQAVTCDAVNARATLLASPNNWTISDVAPTISCPTNNNQNNNQNNSSSSSVAANELAQTGSSVNGYSEFAWLLVIVGTLVLVSPRVLKKFNQ